MQESRHMPGTIARADKVNDHVVDNHITGTIVAVHMSEEFGRPYPMCEVQWDGVPNTIRPSYSSVVGFRLGEGARVQAKRTGRGIELFEVPQFNA